MLVEGRAIHSYHNQEMSVYPRETIVGDMEPLKNGKRLIHLDLAYASTAECCQFQAGFASHGVVFVVG